MHNHAIAAVAQDDMKVVNRLAARTLQLQVSIYGFRKAKSLQRMIHKMRAQIKQNAAAGARQFAPALARLGTVTVVVRFEMRDFAECATRDNLAHSQKVRVPTAILKNGDQSPAALCQGDEFRRFGECVGEGLVHHNVFAGVKGLAGEIEVRGIRSRDHDQINFWKSERSL